MTHCQRSRRLGANHLHAVGKDQHVLQTAQRKVLTVLRCDAIAAWRNHDSLLSRREFLGNEALQIERHAVGLGCGCVHGHGTK